MEFVALISGGKDSFFSLLHCLNNGHKLVALANLHPPSLSPDDSEEMDSFMYQTVGCNVIPLYSLILKVPLYRKPILGKSLNTDLAYNPTSTSSDSGDETEDLYELLKLVLEKHPGVKAVSSGAILSTYQRTRVESVCGRLGLTSLSWLWMRSQRKLLEEMSDAGLDARIIKVASLGLDEKFLGKTVTDYSTRMKLEDVRSKWGGNVAGEGGEFETLVFGCKGWPAKIEVTDSKVVHEEGDVKWLRISGCKVVEEEEAGSQLGPIKKPALLEQAFQEILEGYQEPSMAKAALLNDSVANNTDHIPPLSITKKTNGTYHIANITAMEDNSSVNPESITANNPAAELTTILSKLSKILDSLSASTRNVTSSHLLIRSMSTFAPINQIYKPFFSSFPNPPSRVCVAIGDCMPPNTNVILSVIVDIPPPQSTIINRKALHVQSRSYWAPANVGPYSQAVLIDGLVSVAGMIGLAPESMSIYTDKDVIGEAVLALQNMVRVGREVGVHGKTGWAGGIAYVRRMEDVHAAEHAWNTWFKPPQRTDKIEDEGDNDDDEEELHEIKEFENNDSDVKPPPLSREMKEIQLLPPPLLTVCVEDLPVNARVEYASIGVDGGYLHNLLHKIEEDEDNEDTLYIKREAVTLHRSRSHAQQMVYFGSHEICWGTLGPDVGTNPAYIADELGDRFVKSGAEIVGITLFVPPLLAQGMAEIVTELGGKDFQIDGVAVVPVKGVYYRPQAGVETEGSWRQDVLGFLIRWQRKSY